MSKLIGARIHITGIVQGVGFRPFVYGLATKYHLNGWVRNSSAGVDIQVDGSPETLKAFTTSLRNEAPPLARIDELQWNRCPSSGFSSFEIIHSQSIPDAFQPISPDVGVCPDCLRELFDPQDRRYHYSFINCTNCGPRFTIIEDIPYDRPNTTMASFTMCSDCAGEYINPLDRRFHAQPVACPLCGPQVWLEASNRHQFNSIHTLSLANDLNLMGNAAISETQNLLSQGKIIAIKGLGGFHLACDAQNPEAVSELRYRKLRVDKPFALMMPDLATVEAHCYLDQSERELLVSSQRPIVILKRKPGSSISNQVAPGQDTLGVMLPYTPLHYLLFIEKPTATLIMTSGNLSEEPIAIDNDDARQRLSGLADVFLMHNRPIRTRCDDSVVRIFGFSSNNSKSLVTIENSSVIPLRRSRGYAPFPVRLPMITPPLLATGTELKNTFCIARDRYAFLSHHIGDLENYETLCSFEDGIKHFENLFRIQPQGLAYDLHPNYLATRYALKRSEDEGIPAFGIQHHHAHIAACMAEHGLPGDQPVIGVAFDGTGFGDDGAIWGGEFLIADYRSYQRPYHLAYIPLPGGDKAIREPWRIALAWLYYAGLEWSEDLPPIKGQGNTQNALDTLETLKRQIQSRLNAPLTSSMGRLFDAISALIGVRQKVNYEAQAAIELEALVDPLETKWYPIDVIETNSAIDPTPMVKDIIVDIQSNVPIPVIAARFHNSISHVVLQVCLLIRLHSGLSTVALSGGVWQNMTLLEKTLKLLHENKFISLIHRQVPANDGGVSLGQAVIAAAKLAKS